MSNTPETTQEPVTTQVPNTTQAPVTTQAPATTQAITQQSESDASLEFMTSKAHIYINRKKGVTDTDPINKEMIYNIDITRDENLKKLSVIDSRMTENQNANTMINMNPVKKNYPSYIYFDINNELNQSFSGSFYVSFDTELFESGDIIPICKLEINKKINTNPNSKDIMLYLTKVENKYYINVDGSNNDNVIISNFFSNENKTLSFLVLYNYKILYTNRDNNTQNILNIGLNDQDEIFTIDTGGIVVKSLIFGNKLSDYDTKIFNTTIKNNIIYNCFIGGIKFYNEFNSFSQLRNSAFFKSKPIQSEQLEQKIITTTTQPPINNVPIIEIPIPQYKSIDSFTNYSPSAELFKNIQY